MRCSYCGVAVTNYPDNGICVCCGGTLPEPPAGIRCPGCGAYSSDAFCSRCGRNIKASPGSVQPVSIPPQMASIPGVNCCPKCRSNRLVFVKRGFSWGLGILGFFLIPVLGLLLGFCGSSKPRIQCTGCGHKWNRS